MKNSVVKEISSVRRYSVDGGAGGGGAVASVMTHRDIGVDVTRADPLMK